MMECQNLWEAIKLGLTLVVGFSIGTWLFATISAPPEQRLLDIGAARYFAWAADHGLSGNISYDDCQILPPDEGDREMGIHLGVFCQADGDTGFYAGLSSVGYVVQTSWSGMEDER